MENKNFSVTQITNIITLVTGVIGIFGVTVAPEAIQSCVESGSALWGIAIVLIAQGISYVNRYRKQDVTLLGGIKR